VHILIDSVCVSYRTQVQCVAVCVAVGVAVGVAAGVAVCVAVLYIDR